MSHTAKKVSYLSVGAVYGNDDGRLALVDTSIPEHAGSQRRPDLGSHTRVRDRVFEQRLARCRHLEHERPELEREEADGGTGRDVREAPRPRRCRRRRRERPASERPGEELARPDRARKALQKAPIDGPVRKGDGHH